MADYIINPWLFYLINVANGINTFINIGLIVSVCCFSIFGCICLIAKFDDDIKNPEELMNKSKPLFEKSIIILCTLILLNCIIPSKESLVQMIIAENVTYSNVEKLTKKGKNVVDYIIKKSKEVN